MKVFTHILLIGILVVGLAGIAYGLLAIRPAPATINYGMSFNTLYAHELGLDWQNVYDAFLDDLGVRKLRLAAHWPMIEPADDAFNFTELDYQINRAREENAEVILAVGRRLPRWPECHVPEWAQGMSWEEQKEEIREQITEVVERYKDESHITHWQVENEPYLTVFAHEHCGDLDEEFLKEEVELVKELDPSRPVLLTDSGNLGTWAGAYQNGDAFGTSVYLFFWNPDVGTFKTILPASFYRVKENVMRLVYGNKPTFLIELSAEPWLLEPITDTSIEVQMERMNPEKFEDILSYARETRLDKQYLWGGEWWYWLKERGHGEFWEKGKELFDKSGGAY